MWRESTVVVYDCGVVRISGERVRCADGCAVLFNREHPQSQDASIPEPVDAIFHARVNWTDERAQDRTVDDLRAASQNSELLSRPVNPTTEHISICRWSLICHLRPRQPQTVYLTKIREHSTCRLPHGLCGPDSGVVFFQLDIGRESRFSSPGGLTNTCGQKHILPHRNQITRHHFMPSPSTGPSITANCWHQTSQLGMFLYKSLKSLD